MNHTENIIALNRSTSSAAWIAKISLFIYLFFVFFGTSVPFQEKITNVEDITTTNPINQFVFSFLYILSLVSLISKRHEVRQFIKAEKFLTFFLLWSLLTVFWSDFIFVSFKRWIQIFGATIICLALLLHSRSSGEALRYVKWILMAYLPLTLLSVILVPAAIQWEFPAWRGLAPHKNLLGQIALVSIIVWFPAIKEREFKKKLIGVFFLGLSLIVFVGARSMTSFLTGGVILGLITLLQIGKFLGHPQIGKFYFFAMTTFSIGILLSTIILAPDIIDSLFALFGKDSTFTGRVDLWVAILWEIKNHPLVGCGFGGYWVMDSIHLEPIFKEFIWIPNEAHMGYLDIFNETGLIGLSLLILMIISYFFNHLKENRTSVWTWLFFAILILNIPESTLFRQNMVTSVLFIFSYIALFTERMKQNLKDNGIR